MGLLGETKVGWDQTLFLMRATMHLASIPLIGKDTKSYVPQISTDDPIQHDELLVFRIAHQTPNFVKDYCEEWIILILEIPTRQRAFKVLGSHPKSLH